MKRTLFVLMLICLSTTLFAQQNDPYRREVDNPMLKEGIETYISQTAQWTKEHNIPGYIICMLCDSYKSYHTFQLTFITDNAYLDKLQLTSYTEVKGMPILIQDKTAAFFKENNSVIDGVLKKYNVKLFDSKAQIDKEKAQLDQETKAYIAEHTIKADSIILRNLGGDKKVAMKDFLPVKISPTDDSIHPIPFRMELTFSGNSLLDTKRYQ